MKNTPVKNKRQLPKHISIPLDSRVLFQPEQFFKETLTPTATKIMEQLFFWASKYEMVFPSHQTLAHAVGCSRETVCRLMKDLVHYGLVARIFRRKTWCYAISSWFKSLKARRRLAILFPVLVIGLPAITKADLKGNVTVTTRNNNDLRITRFSNLTCSSLFNTELYCTGKRENVTSVKNVSIKGRVMSDNSPVSAIVKKITPQLNLTKWGQIRLSAFPDEILTIASDNLLNSKKKIDNRFAWFFSTCIALCGERKIAPDWEKIDRLKEEYGQPFDAQMTLPGDHPEFVNKITKAHRTEPIAGSKPYSGHIPDEDLREIENHKAKYGNKPRPTGLTKEIERFKAGDISLLNQFSKGNPFVAMIKEQLQIKEQPQVWWNADLAEEKT